MANIKKRANWKTNKKLIGHGVCPFCGRILKNKNKEFCQYCTNEGFDEVYKMFGKTNGWDERPRRVARSASGWRGRAVVGGDFTKKVLCAEGF